MMCCDALIEKAGDERKCEGPSRALAQAGIGRGSARSSCSASRRRRHRAGAGRARKVAVPMSPLSPARSDVSPQRPLICCFRASTRCRARPAHSAAAAEAAARPRARDRARALARRHRAAAREGRIQKGDWARSSFRLQPVVEKVPLTMDTAPVRFAASCMTSVARVNGVFVRPTSPRVRRAATAVK